MRYAKVVVTLTAVLMVVGMASAQTSRQTASTDTAAVEALTAEIRALRTELAESARTGLRLQLLTARIQAQEQRIIYLDRQRTDAAARRVNIEQVRNETAAQTQQFSASALAAVPVDQRRDFEFVMAEAKRRLADAGSTCCSRRRQTRTTPQCARARSRAAGAISTRGSTTSRDLSEHGKR